MTYLVIGPGSLVGSRFVEIIGGENVYGAGGQLDQDTPSLAGFSPLDVTDKSSVEEVIKNFPGKFVVNFAGATLVDEIEKTKPQDLNNLQELENSIAYKVNVLGTRYIAEACKKYQKSPIFISTSFVFDGKNGPYSESDSIASDPSKISFYGWTKVLAEKEVEEAGIESLTLRISYPYRSEYPQKLDFARNLLKLYDEKRLYPIFTDQTLTPTLTDDLAPAVKLLVKKGATGIFHLTSPQVCTPYQFCCELLKVARGVENADKVVPKGSLVEFQKSHPEIAKRPLKGGEKSDKIQRLGFTPTSWKEGIFRAFEKNT